MNAIDSFFLSRTEPDKSCLLYLRGYILSQSDKVSEHWKYGMPFYYYNGKMWCYLWQHKKLKVPYIGFFDSQQMTHKDLLQEKREFIKIFLIAPDKDIPIKKLNDLFKQALKLAEKRTGKV
ncbi:MAG: DUF1801 domain-containing protein [Bacteroidia bacterium]|nr:DUF1801 domain-containing protein [Bacteroidia bacterium]